MWAAAALLLIALTAATAVHWVRHAETARNHANNPVMAHFYGAPPMAMMTVGAGTILLGKDLLGLRAADDLDWALWTVGAVSILLGKDLLGLRAADDLDWALWTVGTITGLTAAANVPYPMFTRHTITASSAFGGWLMPVVPPWCRPPPVPF